MRLPFLLALLCLSTSATAGFFSSSTGKDDDCTAVHSRAWCQLDLVRQLMGVTDVPKGTPRSYAVRSSEADLALKTASVAVGVGQLAGAPQGLPGVGRAGNGLLMFAALFDSSAEFAAKPKAFAIVPGSVASASQAREVVLAAVKRTLQVQFGVVIGDPIEGKSPDLPSFVRFPIYASASGGICDGRRCAFSSGALQRNNIYSEYRELPSPKWLDPNGGTVSFASSGALPLLFVDGNFAFAEESDWVRFSEEMPDWFYVYLPATAQRDFPVLLNRGVASFFVAPE